MWLPSAVQTRTSPQQKGPRVLCFIELSPGGISYCVLYPVEPALSPKSEAEAVGFISNIQPLLCSLSLLLPGLSALVRMTAIYPNPGPQPSHGCSTNVTVCLWDADDLFLSGILSRSQWARIRFQGRWSLPGISPCGKKAFSNPAICGQGLCLGCQCVWYYTSSCRELEYPQKRIPVLM